MEVLVVIAIIAVLAGLGFGTYLLMNQRAAENKTALMIENLSSSVEARRSQGFSAEELGALSSILDVNDTFPAGNGSDTSTGNLVSFLSGDYNGDGEVDDDRAPAFKEIDPKYEGKGRYVREIGGVHVIVDAWNNPMFYLYPGVNNNVADGFDLWSAGPDQESGTEDDITNW